MTVASEDYRPNHIGTVVKSLDEWVLFYESVEGWKTVSRSSFREIMDLVSIMSVWKKMTLNHTLPVVM